MTTTTAFFVTVAVVVGLAALVVLVMARPLRRILADICGSAERGNFWALFSSLFIVLSTLLLALFQTPLASGPITQADLLTHSLATFRLGLIGLIASLAIVGVMMIGLIRARPDRDR